MLSLTMCPFLEPQTIGFSVQWRMMLSLTIHCLQLSMNTTPDFALQVLESQLKI